MTVDTLTGEVEGYCSPITPLEREKIRADCSEEDVRLAEEEVRKLRRYIANLETRLKAGYQEVPQAKAAKAIARYYTTVFKKDKRWRFGEKRMQCVVARLKEERDPEYICRAIDGLAIGTYVNPQTGMRYDDLELVCRNEVNLEKFYTLAEHSDAPTQLNQAWRDELTGADKDPILYTTDEATTEPTDTD